MKRACLWRRVFFAVLVGILGATKNESVWAADVRSVLTGLSRQHGFVIEGIEQVPLEEEETPDRHGDLRTELGELLRNYNYLLVSGYGRSVEKIVIVGPKRGGLASAARAAVRMTRDGMHHRVEALLIGPNGETVPTSLIIDTGATNVVLPESMMAALGFSSSELRSTVSQTASGAIRVKLALLRSVAVGSNVARDVGVAFVEDRKLGDLRLLGMSFLGRFRLTIDDENNELILLSR